MPLILIADDDPAYRALIRKTLTNPTYIFIEAKNGQRALATVRAYPLDLAILDILMPWLNGLQLCQLMKSDPELRTTRILLLTALKSMADRSSGLSAGCDAYLAKPCEIVRLRETVAQLLSSQVR